MSESPKILSPSPRRSPARKVLRWTGLLLLVVLTLSLGALTWARVQLGRSLPALDGDLQLAGLSAPVTIGRDTLGIATIAGATRLDVARGLGFVHGQDRFFQMDLARRRAAGELSALIGASTLRLDRQTRILGLRAHARRAVEQATADERALLEAYTAGVNAGLASLAAAPFEYLVLRAEPEPWTPEDCALVVASMYLQLQDAFGQRERRLALIHAALPPQLADFLTTTASEWETPLVGEGQPNPAVPGPEVFDLRRLPKAASVEPREQRHASPAHDWTRAIAARLSASEPDEARVPGSNNWVVAGEHTAEGGALVANDMHLGLSVPHVWYRASMTWGPAGEFRAIGVTLPGTPSLIVGSNGHVAWGFTNTTADWSDLVALEIDPADPTRYRTPQGWLAFTTRREDIGVARGATEVLDVRETIWGPVGEPDALGRQYAIAWVALRPGGLNVRAVEMERAETVEQAFALASEVGIPAQNLVAADRDGRIGWTVAGRIPRRVGFDGGLPESWADGSRGWDGWVSASSYPRVVDPETGRIVTANNRLVDGDALRLLGDGGYDPGARARQIRDDLLAIPRATPGDMLRVQLDDRALFLDRWRTLLLRTLSAPALTGADTRRALRAAVETTWTGRASPDSAAYRLVREFRQRVAELALAPLYAEVRKIDGEFPVAQGRGGEGPLWALVSERPPHLLAPEYRDWNELLLAAADRVAADAVRDSGAIERHTWGRFNTPRIQHPLSRAVPQLSRWLDMPAIALAGDSHMPRVQLQDFGASQRMVVSPGHEDRGYFHMPGGQSGHPLSPHFADMHAAWAAGEPTPFLPGPAVHVLRLRP
jgi:penicillin amidase